MGLLSKLFGSYQESVGNNRMSGIVNHDVLYAAACSGNEHALSKLTEMAAGGDAEAKFCLGSCYFGGLGVEQDGMRAIRLFREARDQGHVLAGRALNMAGLS